MSDKLDRGSIVEKRVKEYGISNTKLAEKLGYQRKAVAEWFKREDLSYEIIFKIGTAIRYDFANDIPELKLYRAELLAAEEPSGTYFTKSEEIRLELARWKAEAYETMKELSALKDKYYQLAIECGKSANDLKTTH